MDLAKVLRRAGRAGEVIIAVRQALQLYEQKGNAVAARGARELQMELASPAFLS
jgi:hypothetical protein